MFGIIPEEHTKGGTNLQFVFIVWLEIRIASTTKRYEKMIIRFLMKQELKGDMLFKTGVKSLLIRKAVEVKASTENLDP